MKADAEPASRVPRGPSAIGDRRSPIGRGARMVGLAIMVAAAATACRDGNGAGAGAPPPPRADVQVPDFDADSAFAMIRHQVAFGPRVPGTEGHAAQLEWMTDYLRPRADTVRLQTFTHRSDDRGTVEMTNVFARFRPELRDRLLLVAHWDTRPMADQDDRRTDEPIPGANDGGSGVAVLLQLADVLSSHSPPIGIDLLLVDGEDFGPGEMFLGSTYFAANLPGGYRPLYGIVVDMVADTDPRFEIEGYSQEYAPEVVSRVWALAEELGYGHLFRRDVGINVSDDHLPLNRAGIRTIDIIDFDYGPGNRYWHTHQDDLRRVSPQGLEAVGTTLTSLIYRGG